MIGRRIRRKAPDLPPKENPMPQLIARLPVTIAINTAVSAAVRIFGGLPAVIEMPAAWDAANLTFQTSGDGTNYFNVYDEFGTEVNVVASASRRIRLEPPQWAGVQYIKIRSGTAGTPVNQTAARTLYIEIWE
jgi:hypothetical protein